ncbi:MAG: response regulator, partial [Myxococcales bacterium]
MAEPLTILVVDDDPSVVTAARGLLSRRGHRIEAVFKAMDAIARIRAGGVDAVLMDVWMPEVDGLSALEEIAGLPNAPRVVLMSGDIDARVEAAVTAGKALACLEKPIDFEVANTLLSGEAPERPLDVRPRQTGSALGAIASQILTRGTAFVDGAPQLPAGTPVSLILDVNGKEPLLLLGVADPAVRLAGKRGLGLKIAALTDAQHET